MSNEKKQDTPKASEPPTFEITAVKFRNPVTLANQGYDEWQKSLMPSPAGGRFIVEDRGNELLFSYSLNGKRTRTRVPKTNVVDVVEQERAPDTEAKKS